MSKYHSCKTIVDDIIFDSNFEANIYKDLRRICRYQDSGITLETKPGIVIKPAMKIFKARRWKCDFRVSHPEWGILNIEAKGFPTREFSLYLEMLEICNPIEFDRLIIIPLSEEVCSAYSKMKSQLWTVEQLRTRLTMPEYWRSVNP